MAEGLEVRQLDLRYGDALAVHGVDLTVSPGEILALVGPSGCGKSTLLRGIAGLQTPRGGQVLWDGQDMHSIQPHQRGFGLMFQDHALFPHRDVAANVAFGLRMQHVPSSDRDMRVREVLEQVGLSGFQRRAINELSGGEAQRVALARTLAPRPRLVMLDEPLGSLDRSLRERLAMDIRTTLRAIGAAAILVTHDQQEAFTVADRVAVMRAGRFERVDTPAALWRDPRHEFVARFLGHVNVLTAHDATRLGLRPPSEGPRDEQLHGVVVLPGALEIVSDGISNALVRNTRFSTMATIIELTMDDSGVALQLIAPHGTSAAAKAAAVQVGDRLHVSVHPRHTAWVALDR